MKQYKWFKLFNLKIFRWNIFIIFLLALILQIPFVTKATVGEMFKRKRPETSSSRSEGYVFKYRRNQSLTFLGCSNLSIVYLLLLIHFNQFILETFSYFLDTIKPEGGSKLILAWVLGSHHPKEYLSFGCRLGLLPDAWGIYKMGKCRREWAIFNLELNKIKS